MCAIIGLYMTNVEERLLEDFDLWRIENKRTEEKNTNNDMVDYTADIFQVEDRETSILDMITISRCGRVPGCQRSESELNGL